MHRWTLGALATTLFFLTIVLAAALSPMASDTWWQLRAGADMWASGRVLLTDTYSHTAAGAFWPNHEWLSQVIFYGVYRLGGLALLSLFAAALIVTAWIITWNLAGGPVLRRLAILLPALVPASEHWAPRPHAFSLLFLPLAVWLILRRRYFWLIPLFFVWANCHGGVLLGLVVSAAALGAALFHEPPASRAGTLKIVGLAFAGCVAAVSLTPLGLSFWVEIPRSLARIRQYPLDEWLAPRLSELPLAPFWVLAAVFCVLLIVNRRSCVHPSDGDSLPARARAAADGAVGGSQRRSVPDVRGAGDLRPAAGACVRGAEQARTKESPGAESRAGGGRHAHGGRRDRVRVSISGRSPQVDAAPGGVAAGAAAVSR